MSSSGFAATALALACLALVYWRILPKPLQGIPYNKTSASRVLGDLPDMLKWSSTTGEPYYFLPKLCQDLASPIAQVFLFPGKRPSVVVADGQEAHDIMLRRTNEFDRSPFFADGFRAWLPDTLPTLASNEQWKHQRRIFSDTMSPSFLQKVNAPRVHQAYTQLLDLWTKKTEIVGESLVNVDKDILYATLEALWNSHFGRSSGALKLQAENLSLPRRKDAATGAEVFQDAMLPDEVACTIVLPNSSQIVMNSPFGVSHQMVALVVVPKLRRAMEAKRRLVEAEITAAVRRLAERKGVKEKDPDDVACAADLMISRAQKLGEDLYSRAMRDDIFTYIVGGFDTTASTIRWGVLLLAAHQDAQIKLRSALEHAHGTSDLPSTEAITRHSIPYLDAVIEEVVRLGDPVPASMRIATCDTQVLGHYIPKGTEVIFPTWGPTHTSPGFPVDDKMRSPTSQEHGGKIGSWDENDMHEFKPERWLKRDRDGREVFDQFAGPAIVFGAGARGCLGKRLALLQMRIFFTLVFWQFELLPTEVRIQAKQAVTRRPENVLVKMRKLR
ncbi:hypothetical protein CERZMDRAFT_70096 [Cercospora zeae-maydis SCOH1-5]|uniref:Cytochrome P450 n=1 Tax=Cercospora zeae-maydis SCOH1-5 TaxID=717836 RepID=A0A6A6F6W6_9PEZI|nr:hypothetical protein CERZMDRAFT_70096 [Cercospora zeae-maydis SCOH1-5]